MWDISASVKMFLVGIKEKFQALLIWSFSIMKKASTERDTSLSVTSKLEKIWLNCKEKNMVIGRSVFRWIMLMISCWLLLLKMSLLLSKLLKNTWTNLKEQNNKLPLSQNQLKLQLNQKLRMLKLKKMNENQSKKFRLNLPRSNKKKINLLLRSKNKNWILMNSRPLLSRKKISQKKLVSKNGWNRINLLQMIAKKSIK